MVSSYDMKSQINKTKKIRHCREENELANTKTKMKNISETVSGGSFG